MYMSRRKSRFLPFAILLVVTLSVVVGALVAFAGIGGGSSKTTNASAAPKDIPDVLEVEQKGLVEIIGGKEKLLFSTNQGAYVNGVAVSPDNQKLAFVLQPPASTNSKGEIDFGADLWLSDRDGSNRKELIHHQSSGEFIFAPMWMPDGNSLVYVVRGRDQIGEPDFRLESYNMGTGARTRLLEDAVDAGLSPDGKTVAYVYYDSATSDPEQFLISQLGSTAPARVLVPADSGIELIQSPVFSPDGTKIAFAASNLFSMAPPKSNDGLTATAAAYAAPQPMSRGGPGPFQHPTLQDVWVVNTDGTGLKKISEIVESQPSVDWSTDGKFIYALGGGGFWKVDAATGQTQQVGPGEPGGIIRILRK